MEKRKLSDLPPVARTLLIPLAYRATESRKPDAMLRDPRAIEILECFDEPLVLASQKPDLDQLATMLRSRRIDQYAWHFLDRYPDAMVVEIGCGLDSRFERIDNGRMRWLGIDLPEVIAVRRELLPETPRGRLIAASVLDFAWMDCVLQEQSPVIFVAEGVLPYFTERDAQRLILALADRFPGSELVFDVLSRFSAQVARLSPAIRKAKAQIGWGVDDGCQLESWGAGIRLLNDDRYAAEGEPRMGRFNLLLLSLPVFANMNHILHIQLGGF